MGVVGAGAGSTACPAHLVVLVGCDRNEVGLREHVGAEGAVGQLQDVVGSHDVEARLILVHGVQDGLRGGRELADTPSLCPSISILWGPDLFPSLSISFLVLPFPSHTLRYFLLSSLLFF